MILSKLSQDIVRRAEEIGIGSGLSGVNAPCIIAATAELCDKKYLGITNYDKNDYPEFFEEERLRCCFKRVFKPSGHMIYEYMLRLIKDKQYDMGFIERSSEKLEEIAQSRDKRMISADSILLLAISEIPLEQRKAVSSEFKVDFSVEETLIDIDKNIYQYVMCEIEKLKSELDAKTEKAKALFEWKPARKIAEPHMIPEWLYQNVNIIYFDKALSMRITDFFGEDIGLVLTVRYSRGVYYLSDNGCALDVLRKNCITEKQYKSVLESIEARFPINGDAVIYEFSQDWQFFKYLQMLIFVAHADLYYEALDTDSMFFDTDFSTPDDLHAEDFDPDKFTQKLKDHFYADYNPEKGVCLAIKTCYSLGESPVSYLFEITSEEMLKISDNKKGETSGEIFENLSFRCQDYTPYKDRIMKVCDRFSAAFDGRDVYLLTDKTEGRGFIKAFLRFINLAVLLSEVGRIIEK